MKTMTCCRQSWGPGLVRDAESATNPTKEQGRLRSLGHTVLVAFVGSICCLAVASAAWAAESEQAPDPRRWQERLDRVQTSLEAGEWARAEAQIGEVLETLTVELGRGRDARSVVALAVAYRALAEAGQGREEDAIWSWSVAQSLEPEMRGARFSRFGQAGAFLERVVLRSPGALDADSEASSLPLEEAADGWTAAPRSAPLPRFLLQIPEEGALSRVEIVVGADGLVRSPVVLEGDDAVRLLHGLEALREWRFRPARVGERAVPSLLTLTDFELPLSFPFAMARHEELSKINNLLIDERWAEAKESAETWMELTLERPRPLRQAIPDLGSALVLLAIAEAGLGEEEAARWHRHLARSFEEGSYRSRPSNLHALASFGLDAYGLPGRGLAEGEEDCGVFLEHSASAQCDLVDLRHGPRAGVRPPRALVAPLPSEAGMRLAPDRVLIRLRVDAEGKPGEPTILAGHSEAVVYRAVESLRRWRFEPARKGEAPVASLIELTFPFALEAPAEEVAAWRATLNAAEVSLRQGESSAALNLLRPLVNELSRGLGGGGWDLLGRAVALQALAKAGSGEPERAVWDWVAAQNLDLTLQHLDLQPFGAAGELFSQYRLGDLGLAYRESSRRTLQAIRTPSPSYVVPEPKIVDIARIRLLVDGEGRPSLPLVRQGRQPGALYSALTAMADWRFAVQESEVSPPWLHEVSLPLSAKLSIEEARVLDSQLAGVYQLTSDRWSRAQISWREAKRTSRHKDPSRAQRLSHVAQMYVPSLALAELDGKKQSRALDSTRRAPKDRWSWGPGEEPATRGGFHKSAEGIYFLGGEVTLPIRMFSPSARYTEAARKARVQGVVVSQVVIDSEGRVSRVEILRGLPMGLDESAAMALRRWRFAPATLEGNPVSVYMNLTVNFFLR